MEDANLIRRLRLDQVPLTVCPLSNVALRAVGSLADHVLPAMLAEELKATVNSDDPAYFGGYIDANLAAARSEMLLRWRVSRPARPGSAVRPGSAISLCWR
jgi:adenosine deaminase